MSDRELLELAAKAACFELSWAHDGSMCWLNECYDGRINTDDPWSPLHDDSDALRLAVKLEMQIIHSENYVVVYAGRSVAAIQITENVFNDRFSATRRAIVRAAAMIQKNKG